MKLIKHVAMVMTLTFTTVAFAEVPEERRTYEKGYVKMCEARASLSGTMVHARYMGHPLSTIMDTTEDRSLQALAMYVYQQPHMASAAGRNMQYQQVKSTVLTECLQAM